MQTTEWFTINRNRLGASEFYLRSPFRSTYFLLTSIVLVIDLAGLCLIAVRYREQFDLFVGIALILAVGPMVLLWLLALRSHQYVHSRFKAGEIEKLVVGSNCDSMLSVAAIVTNKGLLFASLSAMGFLGALSGILGTR